MQGANNSLTVIEEVGSVDPTKLRVVVSQMLPTKQTTVQQPVGGDCLSARTRHAKNCMSGGFIHCVGMLVHSGRAG